MSVIRDTRTQTIFAVGALLVSLIGHALGGTAHVSGESLARATFAGGCFWCVEAAFEGLPGVVSVTSGYSGGTKKNPTYEEVGSGTTGHAESVQILYDPKKMTYARLLDLYWHNIDPVSANGQFCDRGNQYRSAIFYHDGAQEPSRRKARGVWRPRADSRGRSRPRSCGSRCSIPPRSTIRTTIRRIRSTTTPTASAAVATRASRKFGVPRHPHIRAAR